jgi:hypothetical protein
MGILVRGVNHGIHLIVTSLAFQFAAYAGLNFGVVSSLFPTSVVFTALIFYILYGE